MNLTALIIQLIAGALGGMQKESPRYHRMIRLWQRLPVCLTRLLGPMIVRGIP